MATLTIPDKNITLTAPEEIRAFFAARGVLFEQWEAAVPFADDADQDTILGAYAHVLQPYMAANGYQSADVINVTPATPNLEALRQKFLGEHTHSEDEVRFFVDGEGYFWFNLGGEEPIFVLHCVKGDLISVPANTPHWFDMGPKTFVKAIRVFTDMSGWTPHYTGSGVETPYNALVAAHQL